MQQQNKFLLIGSPVAHSLSPFIHQAFAKQFNLDITYDSLDLQPDGLINFLQNFATQFSGANITAPLKEKIYPLIPNLTARAQYAGAINTIKVQADGSLLGDNTDGIGFIRDITMRHSVPITDQNIVVLGAGGAARGILPAILELQPQSVTLINRDINKAHKIAADFAALGKIYAHHTCADHVDLLINATSVRLNTANITANYYYDLNYKLQSKTNIGHVTNGLGMLVEQAAESFYIWHGLRPLTEPVIALLNKTTLL